MAVVERFKQELMYGLSAGTKKCGCCREVAVSGGSTVSGLSGNMMSCRPIRSSSLFKARLKSALPWIK